VLQILAAPLEVEVSRNPALVGRPLDYLLQSKGPMETKLLGYQTKGRNHVVTLVEQPLGCGGMRTLTFPTLPPGTVSTDKRPVRWKIEVRVRFGRGFVLEEDYEIRVETGPTAGPSTDRTSG
jgi:hypothetical protein